MKFTSKKIAIVVSAYIASSFPLLFIKFASLQDFLTLKYFVFTFLALLTLGIYAILWQKVLSFMPLHKAYLYKSPTIIIVLLYSAILFNETITTNNIIGLLFILAGLYILSWKK